MCPNGNNISANFPQVKYIVDYKIIVFYIIALILQDAKKLKYILVEIYWMPCNLDTRIGWEDHSTKVVCIACADRLVLAVEHISFSSDSVFVCNTS